MGNVLVSTSNFPRWSGDSTTPFVLNLALDLASLGWTSRVCAPHAPGARTRDTIGGLEITRFRYFSPASGQTVCYQGGALINLRTSPSNYFKLPMLVAAEWMAVQRQLATGSYDILHSHWILPQGFVGALAVRRGVPHVITVHGGDIFALRGKMLEGFKRFALRRADAITVNSSVTEKAVMALDPGSVPVHRIPMGVDTDVRGKDDPGVEEIRNLYSPGSGPFLVFVGRLVEEKGIGDLLEAVLILRQSFPGICLVIAGDGQDRHLFETMVRRLGLDDCVRFSGWLEEAKVPTLLASADIFVSPSRNEAQGLSILEAMSARTPVVATRVGGVVDSVIHETTGLLVDESAPQQIAAAVERLVRDDGLSARLASNARERVVAGFSRAASARAFSELFAELAAKRQVK